MFWRDTELSWWWYRAPIESQAMMIEAFDEVINDVESVKDCRVWLLKQKQTQDWKTTKATADAIYSLLLRGSDLLASTSLVEVEVGGERPGEETAEDVEDRQHAGQEAPACPAGFADRVSPGSVSIWQANSRRPAWAPRAVSGWPATASS